MFGVRYPMYIADLIRTRLVQDGLPVIDMRLRSEMELGRFQGEMALSRNRREVYPAPAAAVVATGTYAVGHAIVYVSLKLIEADNARILTAGDFELPRTADVNRLLLGPVTSR